MGSRRFPIAVGPVSDDIASVQDMLTPVAGAVVPLTQLQSDLYSFLLGSDGIASVQDMLTSVPGAIVLLTQLQSDLSSFLLGIAGAEAPLTQLQSDLSSFLLGIAGLEPVANGLRGSDGAGRSAVPLVLLLAGVPGVRLASNTTGIETPGGIAPSTFGATSQVGRASSLPGMAPPASNGAIPMGVRSFLRHAYRDLPLPLAVSLSALAAAALPGAGGLVILTAAGVRVGYRQAKAGFALRTTGIARYAGPGPLGVVRSGSLVVVRPRALRVARPEALSAGSLLDKVA